MRHITISDSTIRQSGTAGYTLSFREKLETARLLDRLGVDVIELNGMDDPRVDSLLIKSIASAVTGSTVAVPVELDGDSPARVFAALREAKKPRLQLAVPLSTVQMEYLAGRKPTAILDAIGTQLTACRALCPEVEFLAGDATRAEPAFLQEALRRAIAAGAGHITLCDAAGELLPQELSAFLRDLQEAVPELKQITLGVRCESVLGLADAAAVAALEQGVAALKASVMPGNGTSLVTLLRILNARGSTLNASTGISAARLGQISEQILQMCRSSRSKGSPFDNGSQTDSGISLTAHDSREAVDKVLRSLGHDLSPEDLDKVYDSFSRIAARKDTVSGRELEAIVASAALQAPPTYKLESYVVNTGNLISATAHLRLSKNGSAMEGVCIGDGPIDAALLAIEQIVGRHYELDDFQIQAVTEGREAMGETVVKLRSEGRLYAGRGISTDIVGASIHAYLNALNKIVYDENP